MNLLSHISHPSSPWLRLLAGGFCSLLMLGCIEPNRAQFTGDATSSNDGSALESEVDGRDTLTTNDLVKAELLPEMDDGRVTLDTVLAFETAQDSEADGALDTVPEPDTEPAIDTTPVLEVDPTAPVNLTCNWGECSADCSDSESCTVACAGWASCDVDCQGASDCKVDCRNNSKCDIDCRGDSDCSKVRCRDDATCVIDCRDRDDCDDFKCDGRARCYLLCDGDDCDCKDAVDCGDGVIACNHAPCPD